MAMQTPGPIISSISEVKKTGLGEHIRCRLNCLLFSRADVHFGSIQDKPLGYHTTQSTASTLRIRKAIAIHTVTRTTLTFTLNNDSIWTLTSMMIELPGVRMTTWWGGVRIGSKQASASAEIKLIMVNRLGLLKLLHLKDYRYILSSHLKEI